MFLPKPAQTAAQTWVANVAELVEMSSDCALAIDDRHQVVAWNGAAERLLGYTSEEVIGRRCAEVLRSVLPTGEPLCRPDCENFANFCGCRPRAVPACRIRRKDGHWVSVGYSSLVMPRQSQGAPNGSVVAIVFLHETSPAQAHTSPHGLLQVFALGKFGLTANGCGVPLERWKRKQAVTLLKYLVTQVDRPVHRERILACMWPDVDEERGCGRLKVTMYYLRAQLRAAGAGEDAVQTVGNAYLLKADAVWVDAHHFEKLAAEGRAHQAKGRVEDALRCYQEAQFLYRGDYLEQDIFADWCAEERERLGELYMEMLTHKSECHAERGEYAEAVQTCRKGLVHDPCREGFHRAVMQHYAALGRPDWALAQYRHCEAVLAREFGVAPLPDTQRVREQLLAQQRSNVVPLKVTGARVAAPDFLARP